MFFAKTVSNIHLKGVVRSYLKEKGVLPGAECHHFPEQVSTLTIVAFENEAEEPPLQDIRIDWTWKNKAYNACVFNLLAADLLGRVRAGKFNELDEETLGVLAGEVDPLVYVFEKTMLAVRRQKAKVLHKHKLQLASKRPGFAQHQALSDELESESGLRRAGRRTGVSV